MARRAAPPEQHDEPNPSISSTASPGPGFAAGAGAGAGRAALAAAAPAGAAVVSCACGPAATSKPARATPTTNTTASTAAIGAIGTQRTGTGSRLAARGTARDAVTPYQARALTIPVSPDTGTDQAGGSELITTAASERARKSATSQPAERSGGKVRHHQLAAPPWLSSSANRISAGSAGRNGQEKG